MKTATIMKYREQGKEYRIVKVYNSPFYHYRIYHVYNDYNKHGYITEHKKEVARFDNMYFCFKWFIDNNIGNW